MPVPLCTVAGNVSTLSTTVTPKVPDVVKPGALGVMVAVPGPVPITVISIEVCPSGITTGLETVAMFALLVASVMGWPPAGALALMKTRVRAPKAGPLKVAPEAGEKLTFTAWTVTDIAPLLKTPARSVAVRVAVPAAFPVMVATPPVPPSGISRGAGGSTTEVFDEANATVVPPAGAGSVSDTWKGRLRPGDRMVEPGSTIVTSRTVTVQAVPVAKPVALPLRLVVPTPEPVTVTGTDVAPAGMVTVAGAETKPLGLWTSA